MKKDDDLFDNINLNEPPGYEQNVESKKIKLKDNMGPEDQVDFGQPQFTISDQDASQNVLAEKLADLERIIAKQGRINTQVLAETNEVQARLVECLEETAQLKNRALEIEERKVEQQGEVIEQMKLQNELLHSILGKLK
ncbi:hypothetical protein NQ317_000383 [Molorchus minor]|uniref:Uncharacterized protein n=1 Tax=Molorchus minor TaxID=1323400 RepID=A0ABQ9JAI3_9CUCU|nr:hypothetical protein NQ317_000383 [Molorchus minor]